MQYHQKDRQFRNIISNKILKIFLRQKATQKIYCADRHLCERGILTIQLIIVREGY